MMVNEEDHLRLQSMRSGFDLDAAWDAIDRIDDLIEAQRRLRVQRRFRLPDCVPDERRHRHAGQRHAALARPRTGQADRQGVQGAAEDQPGRSRPVRRRQPGAGRLLPDLQPGDAGQERSRRLNDIHSVIQEIIKYERHGAIDADARSPTDHSRQSRPGPGHAAIGDHDDFRRDDGTAVGRPPGHASEADRRPGPGHGERIVHPHAAGPFAKARRASRSTARHGTPPEHDTCARTSAPQERVHDQGRIDAPEVRIAARRRLLRLPHRLDDRPLVAGAARIGGKGPGRAILGLHLRQELAHLRLRVLDRLGRDCRGIWPPLVVGVAGTLDAWGNHGVLSTVHRPHRRACRILASMRLASPSARSSSSLGGDLRGSRLAAAASSPESMAAEAP